MFFYKEHSMNKTPILLLAYNRPLILKQTLDALSKCRNSRDYPVYVHVDSPNIYREDDVKKNEEVKQVLSYYSGCFYFFEIFEEEHHLGLAQSVIKGVSTVLSMRERVIVIEDDWILSYDCLDFLNDALEYYENNNKIWSVTGYCPILAGLKEYNKSVFMTYRASSRVWATWKDRWDKVDWDLRDYGDFATDRKKRSQFCRGGYDLPKTLKLQVDGTLDSWGIRWAYEQHKQNALTVYPTQNRVYHIGAFDGTHVHSEFPQKELLESYPDYHFEVNIDDKLIEEYQIQCGDPNTWDVCFGAKDDMIAKFENMFNIMHLWKEISEKGHSISEYFLSRNYRRIAIYGKGKIGRHIEKEVIKSGIEVAYYIDRNEMLQDGISCIGPQSILPQCDCVVISVIDGMSNVKNALNESFAGDIKSITDVIKDR